MEGVIERVRSDGVLWVGWEVREGDATRVDRKRNLKEFNVVGERPGGEVGWEQNQPVTVWWEQSGTNRYSVEGTGPARKE